MTGSKDLSQARNYAFLLLKYRPRSRKELRDRLRGRKFPDDLVDRVIESLESGGLIDDAAFARCWIASRAGRKYGPRRIRQELRLKGVDRHIIDAGLAELDARGPEEETVRSLARDKLRKLNGLDPRIAKRRVYAYFLRRGFSPEIVSEILNEL